MSSPRNPIPSSSVVSPEGALIASRVPLFRHLVAIWRLARRWLSRRELTIRLLGLEPVHPFSDDPGLIILQVDGLARSRLDDALRQGRMPFLASLIHRDGYKIHTMYSGQPATTPAVLGELFYGVEQAVPAFSFRDHRTGAVVEMLDPEIAERVQAELAARGEGLLKGGAAYCDIYSGGADEAQFCPGRARWKRLHDARVWKKAFVLVLHLPSIVRLIATIFGEAILTTSRLVRRQLRVYDWWSEIKFVVRYLIASVVLKEAATIAVETDAVRGLPCVHANFLGYDDVSHHCGPESAVAFRTLRDIDRSLRRVCKAAEASHRRHYQVWIMADHGQETSTPYSQAFGESVNVAVERVARQFLPSDVFPEPEDRGEELRAQNEQAADRKLQTVAIGPLGYVYWPSPLDDMQRHDIATRLVADACIPIVLTKHGHEVRAYTPQGVHILPEGAATLVKPDHPFLLTVGEDLAQLCTHPDAGDFMICGWKSDGSSLSFVTELGAHAGPGPMETSGFVVLPDDAPPVPGTTLRPKMLRQLALEWLGSSPRKQTRSTPRRPFLRVATYNVHGCVGLDGRLSPVRIARVLAGLDADVIALQELDGGRSRSGAIDQAQAIAEILEMEMHFGAAIDVAGERYGNAILSRWPMTLRRAALLPGSHARREPRGALWASVEFDGERIDVLCTHFGLSRAERKLQTEELLGEAWPCASDRNNRTILCGDFNASPGSDACRELRKHMRDVQLLDDRRGKATWPSRVPLRRIDHLFVGPGIRVIKVDVPRTRLMMVASDHLPLVADLAFVPSPIGAPPTLHRTGRVEPTSA